MSEIDDDNDGASAPTPPPRKKRVVQATLIDHTYIDYSTYQQMTDTNASKKGHDRSTDNFPRKLHYILSRPEYHHIISWMPHGRAWKIWNKELLVSVVCKEQFKHEKFESFNRQVNGWGFKRLFGNGPDHKCYYNQFFLRGLPDLTSHMHRLDKPGKRLPNKLEEPDFYEISRRFPLPETNASCRSAAHWKNDSSAMLLDSHSLADYSSKPSREHCLAQSFRFDNNERSSTIDAAPTASSASVIPKVVSRGSSENKAPQWLPALQNESQDKLNDSLPVQDHRMSRQDMKISNANSTPFEYHPTQFGEVPSSYYIRYEQNYECHGLTQDPYFWKKSFDAKESRYKVQQEQSLIHEKHCKIRSLSVNDHDNEVKHHEAATSNDDSSCSTELWDHHPLLEQYEDQHQGEQPEGQQYCVQYNQTYAVMPHSIPFEHQGYNLSMHYTPYDPHSNTMPDCCQREHCADQYPPQHQRYSAEYSDPFKLHYTSTVHYAQSYLGLESNAQVSDKRIHPFSSRSWNHNQGQHQYNIQHPSYQMHDSKRTSGHTTTHNAPFDPNGYHSNENYERNACAFDKPQYHHEGADTEHQLQPKCVMDKTSKSGYQSLQKPGRKLSALEKSFDSDNPNSRSQHSHHSISPLSRLMDSFLDFEQSPSMFDDKSK